MSAKQNQDPESTLYEHVQPYPLEEQQPNLQLRGYTQVAEPSPNRSLICR